jgi:homoserine dehydrogenase
MFFGRQASASDMNLSFRDYRFGTLRRENLSSVNVGIIGFGTVGAGAFELLSVNREIIRNRAGIDVVVKKIADLDIESDRGVPVDRELLTTNAMEILDDPDIHVVVELVGGLAKAKDFVLGALERQKHVVTANKALLAEFGSELYDTAHKNGVTLSFEASVCGGIPIVGAIKHGFAGNHINVIRGILNGTSNYILTRMTKEGLPYDLAVQQAVDLGFAEDPPTLDVDGTDAAHKLAILISILFGYPVNHADIYREGIEVLTPEDIRFADEFGYVIKLLAIVRSHGECLEARVHPAMIPRNSILANVNGAFNAVYLEGDFVGPSLFYGLGAGRRPTGSAIVSDIIGVVRHIHLGANRFIPPLAHFLPPEKGVTIKPVHKLGSAYYFRVPVLDRPGVLSKISGILGDHEISISSVIQKGRDMTGSVSIVMLTHEARETDVIQAISRINDLKMVSGKTVMIRVEKD